MGALCGDVDDSEAGLRLPFLVQIAHDLPEQRGLRLELVLQADELAAHVVHLPVDPWLGPPLLGHSCRLVARWNRLGETVKTRKQRGKTGGKWARYGPKSVDKEGTGGITWMPLYVIWMPPTLR